MKTLIAVTALAVAAWGQQGWYPHEGGLMKYRVNIRFGEEPDTMPDGWKFGRVSAVSVNANGEIFIGSLTGNVFRCYPGWLTQGLGATEGLKQGN